MPRPSKKELLDKKVREYLARVETDLPEESPIDVKTVAELLNVSRTTIYKYGLDKEIHASAERQRQRVGLSAKASERRAYADIIRELRQELEQERERNKKLVERIILMETNAARFKVYREELLKPLPKPNRKVSRAGKGKKKKK